MNERIRNMKYGIRLEGSLIRFKLKKFGLITIRVQGLFKPLTLTPLLVQEAMSVWDSIFKWWKVGDVNVYSIDEFFSSNGNINVPTFLSCVWQAVIWSTGYFIWKERNARVFGNKWGHKGGGLGGVGRRGGLEGHCEDWQKDRSGEGRVHFLLGVVLGDGRDIILWVDRWVDDRRLSNRFSRLYHLDKRKESSVWEKGSWDNNVWCWERDWITEIRCRVSKEFEDLLGVLQNLFIHNNCRDKWRCLLAEDGNFAV
nr:putative ribonuclease H protein At1g65750 family [Tanacetum cinerariifolium]